MKHIRAALVTGANKGIGFQIAKQLTEHGLTVYVGSRDFSKGVAAALEIGQDARAIQLDVTDTRSVTAAAKRIEHEIGHLDVLVNNAGISGIYSPGASLEERLRQNVPSDAPMNSVRGVFETNVFGVIAMTQAMLPLLHLSNAGRIVNIGSSASSLTLASDPSYPFRRFFGLQYSASKAALNAVSLAFAIELERTNIKVNVACPGFVATDMNDFQGTRTTEEGAREAVRLALLGQDGPTATFSDENGIVPW